MNKTSQFNTTVASLYETVLDPSLWQIAIKDVALLFDASTAAMFRYDCRTQTPSDFRLYGHDAAVERLYAGHYHRLDPGRLRGMNARFGEWLADEQMLDMRSPHQQEYVRDFAIPCGIGHAAGFKVTDDPEDFVFLGMQRRPDAPRFGEAARQAFVAIQPHMHRVARMHERVESVSVGNALARASLDLLQVGVMVLNALRRVHLINEAGRKMLCATSAIAIAGSRLICHRPSQQEQLARSISAACSAQACGGALRVTDDRSGLSLSVVVVPIPRTHDLACVLPEPLAMVMLADPRAPHLSADVYRALFSLSPAEAALMVALVDGLTASEWAVTKGTSMATVRSQIKSLFEKTGAHSQAHLVGLAKTLPSLV